ncbi:MAG: NUDIX hydrolase [Bacilli bacterium]|nr:NUDIX hydrolase [Bacilli bacterium]
MDWTLRRIEKETDHRFLNFFVFHYEVEKEGKVTDYPYFLASRREKDDLQALTKKGLADGVIVCALTEEEDPSLLLIEVFRPALNDYVVEFPAGLTEGDASPLDTAVRETLEETGFVLKDVRLLCPPSPTSSGLSDELVAVVEGRIDAQSIRHLEDYEDISYRLVKLSKVKDYFGTCGHMVALNVRLLVERLLEKHHG